MRLTASLLCLSMILMLSACDRATAPEPAVSDDLPAPDETPAAPASASATLAATEGSTVSGELHFEAVAGGVRISGQVAGLGADGEHGLHVHETGDCSAADASSAGGHFNPTGSAHGRVGAPPHHVGDTDNLVADAQGMATVDHRLEGATLGDGAATDILGKGAIVHAKADDYVSQPTGDAGDRLACGVIEARM